MSSPLWKILLKIRQTQSYAPLTCDECFAILEYLADQAARGTSWETLHQLAREHLARCPGCREVHWRRLRELEKATRPEG
jgi:uncharacterized protein with PIN domain